MKVLEHGNLFKFDAYVVQCKECACKIEFKRKDIRKHFLFETTYIICPECKHEIYFDLNSVN